MSVASIKRFAAGTAVVAAVLLLAGCALVDRMSGVAQARELRATGAPADATILKIWDTGMTVNHNPVVGFLLEVRPSSGAPYQATTKMVISRLRVSRFQEGAIVPVRVDPRNPARVALEILHESR